MKNVKTIKKLLILVVSIALVFTISNFVYADDDDPFLPITASTNNEAANTNTEAENSTNTNNTLMSNGAITTNNTTNNATTNTVNSTVNTTNNVNRSVTNTNQLAKTGLTDSNGIIALIVVLCSISAIYSYKKVNDYKKL